MHAAASAPPLWHPSPTLLPPTITQPHGLTSDDTRAVVAMRPPQRNAPLPVALIIVSAQSKKKVLVPTRRRSQERQRDAACEACCQPTRCLGIVQLVELDEVVQRVEGAVAVGRVQQLHALPIQRLNLVVLQPTLVTKCEDELGTAFARAEQEKTVRLGSDVDCENKMGRQHNAPRTSWQTQRLLAAA